MTTSEQRNLIRSKIEAGASPQQVYDELHGPGSVPDEKLADLVRYTPTLERRRQYRTMNLALLVLLGVAIAWKLGVEIPAAMGRNAVAILPPSIYGIGYAVSLIGVAKYWRRLQGWAGMIAFFEVMRQATSPVDPVGAFALLPLVVLVAIAILGFNLQRKLTPAYITLKEAYLNADGQQRLKQVVRFGD